MSAFKGKEHLSWASFRQNLGFADDLYCEPASPTAIGIPIKEELIVVSCSLCSRPVLHSGFSKHFVTCKKASLSGKSKTAKFSNGLVTKKKKQNGSTSTSVAGFTLSGGPSTSLSSSSTSVFSEITPCRTLTSFGLDKSPSVTVISEGISPASLKTPKAESSKESTKKVKGGPINLDLQCGVMHDNGLPCARSITCKIHSVSLKRAVAGRTHPYDSLYQEYQAKALLARGFKDAKSAIASKSMARTTMESVMGAEKINQEEEVNRVMAALKSHQPCALVATAASQQQQTISSLGVWMAYKTRITMQDAFRDREATGAGFQAC
ncbi:hypothetical protein BATDEDRAFT_26922 [Batrachochytrium dendrobatidis JAM81]|uniref:SCA7 domain-containing protein n=2 Tax=Batrachochytrium dendrobatidis TaxID=109871 RepID=F4P9J3_BATDJ|nr:uncharacterized protein BATDEDRAFT_26922 [Batrachochytrium dendrobatidis JAM81]EGF78163.1 hypothetical protein BATDEDRAFT_26922 [Batrachochytrium dendrobatidis JAM81]KAJ8330650.1 SAGA complex subunit Sgf73 [Batrachochytrium dendrobatidis]OAJ44435.1 hypothetical protein BDEG_27663 [Batrachochytrium dendrobatidis JEL423]|eukprot:XP_006681089.1 hypothetical protein BATDEDRAFT_26922 [Batrachochytrium dendrobatidis JAM81]